MSPRHRRTSTPTSPPGTVDAYHVWKRFRSETNRPLLREQFQRVRARMSGQRADWTWVLRDIDLHIDPGESVALIGLNGSGKSTLLKVLSRVMYPNAGRVELSGRIGALIEVRAGIHPDLTGRENIFFYGTILGLSRREVAKRFDGIIAFAELEGAVERQVKFYSSGMQMRLGFGIAAFLEPDILLVDEVLSVGDVNFQQRCLERMKTVLDQGTTLVFVSHDMAAVEAMCSRAVWLDNSIMRADGPVVDVLQGYRRGLEERAAAYSADFADAIRIVDCAVHSPEGEQPVAGGPVDIALGLESVGRHDVQITVGVSEGPAAPIFLLRQETAVPDGYSRLGCHIVSLPLPRGRYYVWAAGSSDRGDNLLSWQPVTHLDVVGEARQGSPRGIMLLSPVHVRARWSSDADELSAITDNGAPIRQFS